MQESASSDAKIVQRLCSVISLVDREACQHECGLPAVFDGEVTYHVRDFFAANASEVAFGGQPIRAFEVPTSANVSSACGPVFCSLLFNRFYDKPSCDTAHCFGSRWGN